MLRSTSRANALTIQNFPTSVQELSSELTVLTFKLSNQIELFYLQYSSHTDVHNSRYVDTTAILRTPSLGLLSRQGYLLSSLLRAKSNPKLDNHSSESNCLVHFSDAIPRTNSRCDWKSSLGRAFVRMSACCIRKTWCFSDVDRTRRRLVG